MIRTGHRFLVTAAFSLAVWGAVLLFGQAARAQETAPPAPEERVPLTPAELEELVGPIALYPDDLMSIVLPASTYPLQIVQAARYLEDYETNNDLAPDDDWDDSVVALLNYPEVIELMNEDLDWTWELGEAALYQQTELLDAIQDFRDRAYAAGNLQTDERQVVTRDADETIVIKSADPQVIYVPYYEPRHVLVHQPYPVYHYYPRAYPVYYYPYSYGHSFGTGFFWGVTTAFSIGWHSHYLNVHHHRHYSHPYYGHYYHGPWYRQHAVNHSYGGNIWRPGYYSGARQQHTATVSRTNRTLGTRSSGRLRNQPSANTPQGSRLRNQPDVGSQTTAGNRRGTARAGTRDRTATVTADAANRARTARARTASGSNRRAGALTRTGTSSPTAGARPGQRSGQRQRGDTQRGATRVLGSATNTRSRSAAAGSRGILRNQPRSTLGSRSPGTLGGMNSRQRTQSGARRDASAQRGTAVRPGTVQRRSFGGTASRPGTVQRRSFGGAASRPGTVQRGSFGGAPSRPGTAQRGSFGGAASRSAPSYGGRSGSVSRSGASANPRASGGGRTRNQR